MCRPDVGIDAQGKRQLVGWVERSDIHQSRLCKHDGFRYALPILRPAAQGNRQAPYSHSIVPGGLLVTSYTTRFTPFTSLMMRVAVSPRNFMSNW
ncbi:hypothetical protein ACVI1I_000939 [Bradyrhizobium sp. USDA 4459]